jgi:anti-sigma factor RsiW
MRQGKCGWARRRKWRYLDGTLPAPQKRQVEAHLQVCLPCRAEFTLAQDALNALAAGKPLTPEQQRALQRPKSWLTPSRAAAVAILALLLGAGVYLWRVQGAALLERLSARGAPAAAVAESAVAAPTPRAD